MHMPTRQQMDWVTQKIEWLQSMSYIIEDGKLVSGPVSDASQPEWEDLSREQQQFVLREDVNWSGFTEAQEADVIRRVLDGEEANFWMDGIAADAASPQRSSSDEATHMDYQPTGRNRHIERVTSRIEELKSAQYWCTEATIPCPHTDDEERDGHWRGVTSDGSGWDNWNNLTVGEKEDVLRHRVDWEGFARAHIRDVIDKVIRDEPVERWMDSVRYPARAPADAQAAPSHPTPSPWPGATKEERIDAWERFRDVDSSGLTLAERDLYYHELVGGGSTTYQLWTPDGERGDFPAGYSVAMTFQAADSENAADMAKERFFDLASGAVLTDTTGDAYRFDGDTFHEFKPEPSPPLPSPLNVAGDVYAGLMNQLEAAADEFVRQASTPEQAALAKGFADFVAGDAHTSLKYLTGLAVAANRPDAMPDLPSPGDADARPIYDNYEISGCKERIDRSDRYIEVADDGETPDFWTLYGHIEGQGVQAIGDFSSREAAEEVYYRITGQQFTGSYEADDRLRLMHASPKLRDALWAAMPFVEQWSEWVFACEDYGEKSDEIDRQLGRMQEIYAEATGGRREEIRVTLGVEQVMAADQFIPFDERDETRVRPEFDTVPDGFAPAVTSDAWSGLERAQKEYALKHNVNWSGYSPDQVGMVIRNVIDGKPKEQWFSGFGPPVPGHTPGAEAMASLPDGNPFGDSEPSPPRLVPGGIGGDDGTGVPKDRLFPGNEPVGYQVWHKQGGDYQYVAFVESNALGAMMTTTHGFLGVERWQNNPGVTAMDGEHRSTTIGDVLIDRSGRNWKITAYNGLSLTPVDPVTRQSPEVPETQAYRIWQANDPSAAAAGWGAFPQDYRAAIEVQAYNLKDACESTNSGNWWEGYDVEVLARGVRSTGVGDVIVDSEGNAYRIKEDGFAEIDPAKEKPAAEEPPLDRVERQLRHWKHDHSREFIPDPATGRIGPGTHRWPEDAWAVMPEADKLRVLETEIDWTGVHVLQKAVVLAREVDFTKIPPDQLDPVYGSLTAALLSNPQSFLPDSGPDSPGAGRGYDHDHGPERGRD
jgi:hypothetical protein